MEFKGRILEVGELEFMELIIKGDVSDFINLT